MGDCPPVATALDQCENHAGRAETDPTVTGDADRRRSAIFRWRPTGSIWRVSLYINACGRGHRAVPNADTDPMDRACGLFRLGRPAVCGCKRASLTTWAERPRRSADLERPQPRQAYHVRSRGPAHPDDRTRSLRHQVDSPRRRGRAAVCSRCALRSAGHGCPETCAPGARLAANASSRRHLHSSTGEDSNRDMRRW
jgi:hypothetical protein